MNKNAIQKYAIWARNELIEQVKQRAYQYGISEKGYGDDNATIIAGRVLSADEKWQRREFVVQIKENGYQQAVEEVAYTWFNRFVALRFMEVNDYLPTHFRVFSDASGGFNPEILTGVLHLELEGLDKAKVSELLNANQTEELYSYLLLTQCNALNEALPEMFELLGSYTEMLLPNNILKLDSVLGRLVTDIPEEDFRDAVQIIGWMYQYYNTEPKQAVFNGLKNNVKITKENIPAATQLFTPDWIVRYMVENSLGRLWLESHPNTALKVNWKYYLDEAEQTSEVAEKLRFMRSQSPMKSPEDIRLIDPCMGSGHILVYAFDVLMQIYVSEGYNPRDAAKLILEKNIYGLDIDRRAYQLAHFSLMMKARQYDRRIFTDDVKPQVYYPAGFPDGVEYGSLVKVDALPPKPEEPKEITLFTEKYETTLNAWHFKRLLMQKYEVVVTNPPYMGGTGMSAKLSQYVKDNYFDSKSDLFSAFIERCGELLYPHGFQSMITMESWMFLSSFEKLREKLFSKQTIINMVHMPYLGKGGTSLGINFGTAAFIISKSRVQGCAAQYNYVRYYETDDEGVPFAFPTINERYRAAKVEDFSKIPGSPVAYWLSKNFFDSFNETNSFTKFASAKAGLSTTDNQRFLRFWWEVFYSRIGFGYTSLRETEDCAYTFIPHPKGGSFRKWYGNLEYVVDWYNNGSRIRKAAEGASGGRIVGSEFYFRSGITWTDLTSTGKLSVRYMPKGMIFNSSSPSCFCTSEDVLPYLMGYMNSCISREYLQFLAPTFHFNAGPIEKLPVIKSEMTLITQLVNECIDVSNVDWDVFETSWDFKRHPLICGERTIAGAYAKWEREASERFDTLKANEEELNRIFIDIYSLADELTSEVKDKDVTVRRADLGRDIRSFISYAVGCMFGRYSIAMDGLAYAGSDWDNSKYKTFIPDKDNILPICDDDYFDDDILGRFVGFVSLVYCADTLEENLNFIADALGGKGTPRDVIRNYFLNDFYKDHLKIYQKRPIYWLFDSGKKNGFKALIYMHRYSRDILAKLRTDYVHEQQERYRTQLSHISSVLNTASGAERAKLLKQQDKLSEQLREISAFEEKVHHLADQNILIDLDDGVKKNYEIFTDVLAKI